MDQPKPLSSAATAVPAAPAPIAPVPTPPKELEQRAGGKGEDRRRTVVDRRMGVDRRQLRRGTPARSGAAAWSGATIPVWNAVAARAGGEVTIARPPRRAR